MTTANDSEEKADVYGADMVLKGKSSIRLALKPSADRVIEDSRASKRVTLGFYLDSY